MTKPKKTPKKQINLLAVVILTVGTILLGGLVYVAHEVQVQRTAGGMREQADVFRAQGENDLAVKALRQFLGMVPEDNEALGKLGLWLEESAKTPLEKVQAYLVLKQAVRRDQDSNLDEK